MISLSKKILFNHGLLFPDKKFEEKVK